MNQPDIVYFLSILLGYNATITKREFQGTSNSRFLSTHQSLQNVAFLNDRLIKQFCKKWISYRKEVSVSLKMTEQITTDHVFLVMVTTTSEENGISEVMALSTCISTAARRYIECEFCIKDVYDDFIWYKYKCPKSSKYLIKSSILVENTSLSRLCEVAIFDE